MDYTLITLDQRPDLIDAADAALDQAWTPIIIRLSEGAADRCWVRMWRMFPAFQFVLLDPATDAIMAVGNSLPLVWTGAHDTLPDTGWDWGIEQGVADHEAGRTPTTQCALSITILPEYQGQGLSSVMVRSMKQIGTDHGLDALIAPVRPNLKPRYPLTPIERYVNWRRDDGLPFDPWLRVHARLGAQIVKVCPQSMTVIDSVANWEDATGMQFPESDTYIVPDALVPVSIDRAADRGVYVEPNVWMVHALP